MRSRYEELCTSDPNIDRGYWRQRIGDLKGLRPADRDFLRKVAWGARGNLRGFGVCRASDSFDRFRGANGGGRSSYVRADGREPTGVDSSISSTPDARSKMMLVWAHTSKPWSGNSARPFGQSCRQIGARCLQVSESLGIEPEKLKLQVRDLRRDRRAADEEPMIEFATGAAVSNLLSRVRQKWSNIRTWCCARRS